MRRHGCGTWIILWGAAGLAASGAGALCSATAAENLIGPTPLTATAGDLSDIVDAIAATVEQAMMLGKQGQAWAYLIHEKAPALAMGLAAMLALLPLTVIGLIARRLRYSEMTLAHRRRRTADGPSTHCEDTARTGFGRPADAWVEFAGPLSGRHWIGRRMVCIGRDEDNEIQLPIGTVHRHHAVIHHTGDSEFIIKDLSSADGNGVMVNGRRVGEARLRNGDKVALGEAMMTFHLKTA